MYLQQYNSLSYRKENKIERENLEEILKTYILLSII